MAGKGIQETCISICVSTEITDFTFHLSSRGSIRLSEGVGSYLRIVGSERFKIKQIENYVVVESVASVGHASVLVCCIKVDKSCPFLICATAGVPALFVSTWAVVRATLADVR